MLESANRVVGGIFLEGDFAFEEMVECPTIFLIVASDA